MMAGTHYHVLGDAAGEVLSLERAISAVNQGTEHLTVPRDVCKDKKSQNHFETGFLST